MMKYKGYIGNVVYDDEAGLFHGDVIGLKDTITFQGKTVDSLVQAFRDSVDVYLEWCKERGEKPDKKFSGKLNLRMPPDLHAQLALEASRKGISLNDLINDRLRK